MWILISWLHQKPADLDLHCFQNTGYNYVVVGSLFVDVSKVFRVLHQGLVYDVVLFCLS